MLPPYWPLQYGTQLVEQTRHLYPNSELAENLSAGWLSKLQANSLPDANINGWSQGITELKRLQNRLNQLDKKKGKYMTVSELKTAVFSISQSLNDSVPVEELIRQLKTSPQNQPLSRDLLNRADLQLNQLNNSYMLVISESK
ncbi:ImpA domain-containing protein [Salmonella enterica]|nr:ImpA domain-containing protein [Salmonella enterica]EGQ6781414.1 ImpA domain-containing protein [Salmonella enterica]